MKKTRQRNPVIMKDGTPMYDLGGTYVSMPDIVVEGGRVSVPDIYVADGYVSLADLVAKLHRRSNPTDQFSAMFFALLSVLKRTEGTSFVTQPEREALVQLSLMLSEARQGRYSDARWPDDSRIRGRKLPYAQSRAEQYLKRLALIKRDGPPPLSLPDACKIAVNDVEVALKKQHGMVISKSLQSYPAEPKGDPRSDRRSSPLEQKLRIAKRVERWITDGRKDDDAFREFPDQRTLPADTVPAERYRKHLRLTVRAFADASKAKVPTQPE
jgi:hypothetical protein